MEISSELIISSKMEQQLEEASAQLDSCLIQYQQLCEAYKKGNPSTGVDLDTKLREVKGAFSEARMCQYLGDLQMNEGRKQKRDEEERKQVHQQQKLVLDKLTVPSDQMGLVAGKQFANKHRLESTYGIQLTIPFRGEGNDVLLLGPAEQVAAAKIDILEDLPVVLTYKVDQRLIRSMRSFDAVALEALRREHKVRFKFGPAEIYIDGRKSRCEKTLTAIQSIIARRSEVFVTVESREATAPLPPVNIEIEVIVPEDTLGFIAGRNFENANRLEKTYGVQVIFPAKGEGNVIVLQGPDAHKLAAARMDIIVNIPVTLTQPIDPHYVGWIIGKKGEVIKRLISDYDVNSIQFDEKKIVIIKGKKDRCEAALKAINALVDECKKMERTA